MGEQAHLPQQPDIPYQNGHQNEHNPPSDDEEDDEFDDMSPEEFQMLDQQLDELDLALDDIEQKNDNIQAQLMQLLQSNREIRRQMQEEANKPASGNPNQAQQ